MYIETHFKYLPEIIAFVDLITNTGKYEKITK